MYLVHTTPQPLRSILLYFHICHGKQKTRNLLSSSHFYDAVSRNAIGLSLIINTNMLHYIVFVCICILPIISRKRQLGSTQSTWIRDLL